jgi:PHD/YefM family antitoxin component YafN of YafNO toxin-antitoxin module
VKQLFGHSAIEMATREFSKNPSRALREADSQPVLVTKYGQPIACVLSIEQYNSMLDKLHDYDILDQIRRS